MEKAMHTLCMLVLCMMISGSGNVVKNGKIINNVIMGNALGNVKEIGNCEDMYLYMGGDIAKGICYISCSVEIQKNGKEEGKGEKIAVIRIIGK